MDKNSGLYMKTVAKIREPSEEFTQAKIQRCQVHVARNAICKVLKKQEQEIADDLRSIFCASSKKKAWKFFYNFEKKCLLSINGFHRIKGGSSLEVHSCGQSAQKLTFFNVPDKPFWGRRDSG